MISYAFMKPQQSPLTCALVAKHEGTNNHKAESNTLYDSKTMDSC